AKAVFGTRICIRGGMPASLLIAGSPAEVEEQVRQLVATVGRDGAYILDGGGAGIPREARPANVRAMFDAIRRHGVY
ncbi:MAG: uroporphyrinogen decarboxylase, partial [Gammaproteobacteria bacterium]|nr:uroporphyrinogen decarboxylase [Gammaproteobacteria bacterium]